MKNIPTKLTLRMDPELVRRAKTYARKSGKSVSAIVADFFELLDDKEKRPSRLTPTVRSLLGVMESSTLDERDYRQHLERKHR
jgi:Family of unknown function (DUF6364)